MWVTGGRDPGPSGSGSRSAFRGVMSGDRADARAGTAIVMDGGLIAGSRPDYGSGPYLRLLVAAVRLARRDLGDARFSAEARRFLSSELVDTFAECIGYGGRFCD